MSEAGQIECGGARLPLYRLNTVIVGSGAAGLACAARLYDEMARTGVERPEERIALVTRGVGLGTSHNAGSDKQTYYKLGAHGSEPDTPLDLAETLAAGGCVHGDVALAEAEGSLRAFHHLVEIGVPFPHNAAGGFVGYKTDFDPRQRATSAGPLTSRFMVHCLLGEVERRGIHVFERHHALAVITREEGGRTAACGLLCARTDRQEAHDRGLVLFDCRNVVAAGGGPGELYRASVYPEGQMGPYAMLFEAGALAQNLTESQFGLASLRPRWNLSGTYQQVIPRYYSTDADGGDEREFLNPWFDSMGALATAIFLKGYQWPFDPEKACGGSSLIDVLVQEETVNRGRRVFMDFRRNPVPTDGLEEFAPEGLGPEALQYLRRSGATQPTPIERLARMNPPSIDLYRQMGVDLWQEPLEVGVCAQHCNGGFAVDWWWESSVAHLFVVGELAGTHGIRRPGGAALNSGQVGALRSAQRIARVYDGPAGTADAFSGAAAAAVDRARAEIARIERAGPPTLDAGQLKRDIQARMSRCAGMVRSPGRVAEALAEAAGEWDSVRRDGLRQDPSGYLDAVEVRELALAERAFLEAIRALLERGSGSRGSHLVTGPGGRLPHPRLGDEWRFLPEKAELRDEILTIAYDASTDEFSAKVTAARPIPTEQSWFENTWAAFREGEVFRRDASDRPRTRPPSR